VPVLLESEDENVSDWNHSHVATGLRRAIVSMIRHHPCSSQNHLHDGTGGSQVFSHLSHGHSFLLEIKDETVFRGEKEKESCIP
jgi:hypothetical protein